MLQILKLNTLPDSVRTDALMDEADTDTTFSSTSPSALALG